MQVGNDSLEEEKQIAIQLRRGEILKVIEEFNGDELPIGKINDDKFNKSLIMVPLEIINGSIRNLEKKITSIYTTDSMDRFLIVGPGLNAILIDTKPERNLYLKETLENIDPELTIDSPILNIEDDEGNLHNIIYIKEHEDLNNCFVEFEIF
jgi:hypothetical protein